MIFFRPEQRFKGSRCRLLRHKELATNTIQPGKSNRLIQSQQAASAAIRENPNRRNQFSMPAQSTRYAFVFWILMTASA